MGLFFVYVFFVVIYIRCYVVRVCCGWVIYFDVFYDYLREIGIYILVLKSVGVLGGV